MLHVTSFLESADIPGDDLWANPHLFGYISPSLLLYQNFVNHADDLFSGQRLSLSTSIPRHGRCIINEVSEVGVLQMFLTFKVTTVHLLCQYRYIVDVFL